MFGSLLSGERTLTELHEQCILADFMLSIPRPIEYSNQVIHSMDAGTLILIATCKPAPGELLGNWAVQGLSEPNFSLYTSQTCQ